MNLDYLSLSLSLIGLYLVYLGAGAKLYPRSLRGREVYRWGGYMFLGMALLLFIEYSPYYFYVQRILRIVLNIWPEDSDIWKHI